jgi:hypothetical protein
VFQEDKDSQVFMVKMFFIMPTEPQIWPTDDVLGVQDTYIGVWN